MLQSLKNGIFLLIFLFAMVQCHPTITMTDLNKIEFNYNSVDDTGLQHGQYAVDYEFCIPRKKGYAKRIHHIEPNVQVFEDSKGRIGCSKNEWLCIISTHDKSWRQKLYQVASLPYVKRIAQTVYE